MDARLLQFGTVSEEELLLKAEGTPYVSIILPTFNESKNVSELLRLIHSEMEGAGYSYECVFVDDSKDDTPKVILEEAKKYGTRIGLVKRIGKTAKTGLTMAFKRGFKEAQGEIIVCMDTDLQHPPSQIKKLVHTVAHREVDVAVASRYTYGGSAEGLSGFFRKLVSKATNYFVWTLLPSTRKTSDPMTGFFAFKKTLLTRVQFSSLGFKILVELLSGLENPLVIDVPFTFLRRREEKSKASIKQGVVAYRDITRLFFIGTRGSTTLRVVLVALISGIVYGAIVILFTNTLHTAGAEGTVRYIKENILILILASSSIPLFGWALRRYNYFTTLSTINPLLMLSFILCTVGAYTYAVGFYSETPTSFLTVATLFTLSYLGIYFLIQPLWHKDFSTLLRPERWFVLGGALFLAPVFIYFVDYTIWWNGALLLLYILVLSQGLFALYLMVYAWETPKRKDDSNKSFSEPHYSFTAIVPCKHEKNTIADTIRAMHAINYPFRKKQILIVIHEDTDDGTIGIVRETLNEIKARNIKLVTYNETPVNKPHGLNKALEQATGDFVCIFDAEDEPHHDLFSVVNTSLLETGADVVQSGVQLMNFDSNWYSTFNVLEYYFWFKSSLHYYAKNGVTPLGGVSVFFRRSFLEQVGGWDMTCLTEDAEIGIRLSQAGAKMSVIYDAQYATREETPPTLMGFIKQRTRWAQGFLQILTKGLSFHFPTLKQKILATYILSWPLIIPFIFLLLPFGIILMFSVSLTPALAVLTNVSLLIFLTFTVTLVLGFYEFTREYQLRFSLTRVVVLVLLFYPYTLLLAVASIRALYRNLAQINAWEKTEHVNVHRKTRVPLGGDATPVHAME